MSKAIFLCSRKPRFDERTSEQLLQICQTLVPDNLKTQPAHKISVNERLAYAVSMNNSAVHVTGSSLLLGYLYEEQGLSWPIPGDNYPDGNYALFRSNEALVEVVSDFSATRTIWYYYDNDLFLASTSQRAVILFLGSFFFDERVIPWTLSTGSLGPQFSWDRRLKRLQPDSSLQLDRMTWSLTLKQTHVAFVEEKRTKEEHRKLLSEAISQTIGTLGHLDFRRWVLQLSGGYDSRAILCLLKENVGVLENFKAVTWGLQASLDEDGNDAKVARELAGALGLQHDYYQTDISSEPIETILDRFILCSEGRIDHLAGYMDGMKIWRKLYESDLDGVIRGDEGFGWTKVTSELAVKRSLDCALCEDFENLKNVIADFKLSPQKLPEEFEKGEAESLDAWRDRLYHAYRIPSILAALSDIKFSYIEQINPLLSKTILKVVRSIPDALRTDKNLFKEFVVAIGPEIPFASKGANANPKNILKLEHTVALLKSEISTDYARRLFGAGFVKYILDGIKKDGTKSKSKKQRLQEFLGLFLSRFIKNRRRQAPHLQLMVDGHVLAFRVYIILKMHQTLQLDSTKLHRLTYKKGS